MAVKVKSTITLVRVNDGATGKGVSKTEVYYYRSTSNTTQTGGSWVTTPPDWVDGTYFWQKIKTTFTDGTASESKPVCVTGGKGNDGATGSAGTSVSSITTEFYLSTSKTTQTGGSWGTTMPTWSPGKYLWTRSKIVYVNPSSTKYTAPICDSSWEAVNEVSVGGRNLLLQSDADVSNNSYPIQTYTMSENMIVDQTYTCTLWGTLGEGKTGFTLYLDRGSISLGLMKNNGDGTFSSTFKGKAGSLDTSKIYVYPTPNSVTTDSSITKIKLEKGNKATDWSPAPEDMATSEDVNNAQDSADDALNKVSQAVIDIDALNKSISHLVTDDKGGSLMTQGPDGWTFNIGAITNTLEDASEKIEELSGSVGGLDDTLNKLEALANDLGEKTAYIVMTTDEKGQPCIELGKQDNEFKVRITNTSVDFMQGSEKIAYISNQSLYIQKAVIKDELQIGEGTGFIWKRRSNGNMGLRWVGDI
nr:MAG TPA: tail protein [Caudoviricetes sp.]